MGAERSCQTCVSLYHIVWRNVLVNDDNFSHGLDNFKSYDWILGHSVDNYCIVVLNKDPRHLQFSRWTWKCLIFRRVPKIAKSSYKRCHVCLSVCPFIWNNSAPTGRIFMIFDICEFFEHLSKKFKSHYNRTRITGTLLEDQYTCMLIPR
jgi:hypothetical protein